MKVTELFEKEFSPKIRIDMRNVKESDKDEIAGMLRGLLCSIDGCGPLQGLTNDAFRNKDPLILDFSSIENAHYFKECVEYYFSDDILERLQVKRRVRRGK